MFTVTLDKQSATFKQILEMLFPKKQFVGQQVKAIDFTFGTGSLWWDILDDPCPCCNSFHFQVTKCDADPSWLDEPEILSNLRQIYLDKYQNQKRFLRIQDEKERHDKIWQSAFDKAKQLTEQYCDKTVIQKNIFNDSYAELGSHKFGVFDPPYLYGNRQAFDYPAGGMDGLIEKVNSSHITPMQLQGPRSWGANGLKKFVGNKSVEEFEERLRKLNEKAPTVLEPKGVLIVKVMDPRHDGKLITNHTKCENLLTNFEVTNIGPYIRQGATTFSTEKNFQNLHGYWMTFRLK
ncbi:MAG: hypothetical protein ACYC9R_12200 [Nitrosotalea sp.]